MAKIHFFGTRSGTEPMEGMHHSSLAIEVGGVYYFFDAGENCVDTSHLLGVDHLKMKAIFISHPHMDHVGGLAGLFWNVRKLTRMSDRRPIDGKINLFIPNLDTWDGILKVLRNSEANFDSEFDIIVNRTKDGVIFQDENIKVTAFHNHHIQSEEGSGWLSYSYLIETEGKKIVFSGDVRDMYDLDELISDGCDILLVESGHHKILKVGEYIGTKNIDKVIFIHHGREIINDRNKVEEIIKNFARPTIISYDGMVENI